MQTQLIQVGSGRTVNDGRSVVIGVQDDKGVGRIVYTGLPNLDPRQLVTLHWVLDNNAGDVVTLGQESGGYLWNIDDSITQYLKDKVLISAYLRITVGDTVRWSSCPFWFRGCGLPDVDAIVEPPTVSAIDQMLQAIQAHQAEMAEQEQRIGDMVADGGRQLGEVTALANQVAEDAQAAESALDKLTNLNATAKTLPPGSDVTVTKTTTPDGYALAFGIPRGDKGDKGDEGEQGPKGDTGATGPQGPKGDTYDDSEVREGISELKNDLVDTKSKISALFVYSRNLLDVSAMVPGYLVNQVYGNIQENKDHSVTELMEIDSNTTFTYSNKSNSYGSFRIAFYDGDKKFISGALEETTFTSPTEAVYMRISDLTFYLKGDAQLEYGSEKTDYVPYRRQIDSSLIDSYTKDEVNAQLLAIRDRKIAPDNTTFFRLSPNLFDRETTIRGYFVNQINGVIQENASYVCSDFIEIDQNTDYTFSGVLGSGHRYAFYDVNHEYITGALNAEGISPYTVTSPNGAAYIRFSLSFTKYNMGGHQFEKGSEATSFMEYGIAHLLPEYAPVNDEFLLNLPSKLYALVGEELNIYFDNLVDGHDTDYVFDVESNVGMQLERCFRFEPTEAGSYPIAISATNRDGGTVRKNSTIYVAAAGAGSGVSRSLIVLGDSTTNNGIAITKLNNNFSGDTMNLVTIGTRGTGANMHEGRSGWTFRHYFNVQIDSGAPDVFNPFYNPDTQTFDAAYYFANSGVAKPDWFFINLGINDVFSYSQDSILSSEIEGLNSMCDAMISSIMEASPETKVGVALTIPPNYSQDAFGKAYKCGQSRARYKRNNVIWVDNLIRRYENREVEGIYLIPIHTNLDTKFNMGMETNYHNKRNTTMTYESPIPNGGVHPVDSGYWQIADVYWFFLKNMEA